MEIKEISKEEFDKAVAPKVIESGYGRNRALLLAAEKKHFKLIFENKNQAMSKLTALYVLRRKLNAQVKIARRGPAVYLGPGEYKATPKK